MRPTLCFYCSPAAFTSRKGTKMGGPPTSRPLNKEAGGPCPTMGDWRPSASNGNRQHCGTLKWVSGAMQAGNSKAVLIYVINANEKVAKEIWSAIDLGHGRKNRSAWAKSDHTKSAVAASKAISERTRCTGIETNYRRSVSLQPSSIINLSGHFLLALAFLAPASVGQAGMIIARRRLLIGAAAF